MTIIMIITVEEDFVPGVIIRKFITRMTDVTDTESMTGTKGVEEGIKKAEEGESNVKRGAGK